MNPETLAARFKTDKAYRRWFEDWWEEDFSIAGRKASLRSHGYVPKIEYAGRSWPAGWVPPHDLEGHPNEGGHFKILSPSNRDYSWQYINSELSGVFIESITPEIARNNQGNLSNIFVVGDFAAEGQAGDIDIRRAFIDGQVRLTSERHLTLSAQGIVVAGSVNVSSNGRITYDLDGAAIGSDFNLSGDNCDGHAQKLMCGGNLNVTGSFEGTSIKVKGSANVRTSANLRAKSKVNIDSINVGEHLSISGSVNNVDLSKSRSKKMSLELAECENLFLENAKISELKIKGSIVNISADKVDVSGRLTASSLKSSVIDMISSRVGGSFLGINVEVGSFHIFESEFDGVTFVNSKFLELLNAKKSVFRRQASFSHCAFPGRVDFSFAKFLEGANFKVGSGTAVNSDSSFKQIGEADFTGCEFSSNASEVCADFDGRETLEAASFELCRFSGVPMFFGCSFHENVSFRGARFEISPPQTTYWAELRSLRYSTFLNSIRDPGPPKEGGRAAALRRAWVQLMAPLGDRRTRENQRLARYERAYTALRQRFSEVSNAKFERMFHTYELRARRRRIDSEASFLEGVVSWIYDRVSVYGQSISRPLLILLGVWLAFGVCYFLIAASFTAPSFLESLVFSTRQIVKPFSAWSRDFTLPATADRSSASGISFWLSSLLKADTPSELVYTTVVRLLASLQSFLGLILLFLSGLATRRAFGVN